MFRRQGTHWYVHLLGVAPEDMGKGVGRMLMRIICEFCLHTVRMRATVGTRMVSCALVVGMGYGVTTLITYISPAFVRGRPLT